MSLTSAATGPRSSSGRARIAATTRVPPSSRGSAAKRVGAALERQRERRDTAAVDRDRHVRHGHAGGGGDLLEQFPLQGVLREPVAAASRSRAPCRRRGSRRACPSSCARWVSGRPRFRARPRRAGASASRERTASSCSGSARCEAHAIAISSSPTSGRDRTSGRAWIGFAEERRNVRQLRVAGARRRRGRRRQRRRARCGRPRRRSPRVTSTWIGPSIVSRLCACRSYRKWRPGCGSSTRTCRVPRSPAAGPAHIATVKTFEPPLTALAGRHVRGSGAEGEEPGLPDGRRRARAARPSHERRPPPLPRTRRQDTQDADVPADVRGRRRTRAHRGGQEEASRSVALHAGRARARARASRPRRARPPAGASSVRSCAGSGTSSIRSCATSARSRASAARMRTRSSGSRSCPRSRCRRTSPTRRSTGSRRRSTRT